MSSRYLIDTSAFARRLTRPEVRAAVDGPMSRGEVAVSDVLALELGYSVRNGPEHQALGAQLARLPRRELIAVDWGRAWEVQGLLAAGGQHRAVRLSDLLLAACAERAGLVVLHYDHDFDVIAGVTGQPAQWVVLRGSVA